MRSLLFVPADSEHKIDKALACAADVVILDLEDSVAPANKAAARDIAAATLTRRRRHGQKLYVRVNALDSGLTREDLETVLPGKPDGLIHPKTETGACVETLAGWAGSDMPIIAIATETAKAMFGLGTYGGLKANLHGLAWGAEDLSNALGAQANRDGAGNLTEPYRLARTMCLYAARAADVEPVDTVYVDFRNEHGLIADCEQAVRDGFTAKMAIHPAQVDVINMVFTPSAGQIAEARKVIDAFAAAGDAGVVGIDGKMFDIPHLNRSRKLLERAALYKLV